MNGCCWGQPTDVPWAIRFPFGSIPHIEQLFQYPDRVSLGFHILNRNGEEPVILEVDTDSWADNAGLRPGDTVRRVGDRDVVRLERDHEMHDAPALLGLLRDVEPNSALSIGVERKGESLNVTGTFTPTPPHSLPVHPTQVYLAVAGWALLAATMVYFPRRTRHGEVMALLMVGYALTRFAIEFFRDDEPPWVFGLTISQNISIVIFAGGLVLWSWLRRFPALPANTLPRHEPVRVVIIESRSS
jgi:phosphatidylglycerol:prolipoprotein diacylglycerol transferase